MRLRGNIAADYALRNFETRYSDLKETTRHLSTGRRIVTSGDDAAGLAVADKFRSQANGYNRAIANAQDGLSLLNIADGGMEKISSMLQKMRQLAVEAANDTYADSDRDALNEDIAALRSEIDREALNAKYNDKTLLAGSADPADVSNLMNKVQGWLEDAESFIEANVPGLAVGAGEMNVTVKWVNSLQNGFAGIAIGDSELRFSVSAFKDMSDDEARRMVTHELTHAMMYHSVQAYRTGQLPSWVIEGTAEWMRGLDDQAQSVRNRYGTANILTGLDNFNYTPQDYVEAYESMEFIDDLDGNPGTVAQFIGDLAAGSSLDAAIAARTDYSNASAFAAAFDSSAAVTADLDAATPSDGDGVGGSPGLGGIPAGAGPQDIQYSIIDETVGTFNFHVGANADEVIAVDLPDVTSTGLYIAGVDLSTREASATSIGLLDTAIERLSEARAKVGAVEKRLENTIDFLGIQEENQTASESKVRDLDFAEASTENARRQILLRSSASAMAQANINPRAILGLL